MQKKWYIGIVIVMLALFGVLNERQPALPNQEIVLKFADPANTASNAVQGALETLKTHLQKLGAENIQIKQEASGHLKISYFSVVDIAVVKELLADDLNTAFEDNQHNPQENSFPIPNKDDDISYQLDIHELQNGSETGWDFDGNLVVTSEIKGDRHLLTDIYSYSKWIEMDAALFSSTCENPFQQSIVWSLENAKGAIPEVRAGPFSA